MEEGVRNLMQLYTPMAIGDFFNPDFAPTKSASRAPLLAFCKNVEEPAPWNAKAFPGLRSRKSQGDFSGDWLLVPPGRDRGRRVGCPLFLLSPLEIANAISGT